MSNREKMRKLFVDMFLLDDREFIFDLRHEQLSMWNSLGVVSLVIGVQEVLGNYFTPSKANCVASVQDVITRFEINGIFFNE
jgi:acyl carrier protein